MYIKCVENSYYSSSKTLQKCTSLPSFTQTTNSSSGSIQSIDEEYRKNAVRWILSYSKKVAKDTHYLAIAYLNKLIKKSIYVTENNYQKIAMSVLLIAAKINQIYPPKITSMMAKCKKTVSKEDVIAMEASILAAFGFDISIDQTPYSYLHKILGNKYSEKLQECQKLLRIVSPFKEIYQFGDQILALSIIYLIIPNLVRQMRLKDNNKIKILGMKIYNIYTKTKEKYEKQKQNRYQK